jgi:hypothetical protein
MASVQPEPWLRALITTTNNNKKTTTTRYYCPILIKFEFSKQIFEKNIQISNFVKIRQVGAELFHADDRRRNKHYEAYTGVLISP